MGRDVKRVPLDFDWPLNEVWEGYLRPDRFDELLCRVCGGDGLTPAAHAVSETFYPHQVGSGGRAERLAWHDKIGQAEVDNLVAKGRLGTLVPREPAEDNPRDWEWQALPRTAEGVNADQHRGGLSGHDAINRMILVRFRCEVLGIAMPCVACDGHCSVEAYPGQRAEAEAWKPSGPPEGEGWQLWETVSEGSPVSPVFASSEDLARWLTTPDGGAAVGPSRRSLTIEQARGFVGKGWAPSFIQTAGGAHDGATFVGTEAALKSTEEAEVRHGRHRQPRDR